MAIAHVGKNDIFTAHDGVPLGFRSNYSDIGKYPHKYIFYPQSSLKKGIARVCISNC